MVQIAGHYDEHAEASTGFDPVPFGDYRAKIIESGIEDISRNNDRGRCLQLTWQIEGGEYNGRLVWQRLNMWAENMNNLDKVRNIANSQFAAIREATGKTSPRDSEELHFITCTIKVKVQKDPNGQFPDRNEITAVKPAAGARQSGAARQTPQRPGPTGQAAPAGQRSAPWPSRQPAPAGLDDDIPF
ncbi:DUF669 domain-containing protein [Martelella lutilitoris]|uniref:DUF669 domain-containing protein n=1 Tax=Martelella lutilitoris TaxID=2583532 RepID=A0A7T7HMA3_9HYPH|nr:DUF669 domain-containing protein [Martelella lutilitoris]QQM31709.1 DUF669 domain-containing protein [Martelella lutilitoris]